jgi:hypothetical protein
MPDKPQKKADRIEVEPKSKTMPRPIQIAPVEMTLKQWCENMVEDIVFNACNIAESANEFEEIKKCAEGDAFPSEQGGTVRRRRNQLNKLQDDNNYMDYLLTVQEQRAKDKMASTDIRFSVKQSYLNYFTAKTQPKGGY